MLPPPDVWTIVLGRKRVSRGNGGVARVGGRGSSGGEDRLKAGLHTACWRPRSAEAPDSGDTIRNSRAVAQLAPRVHVWLVPFRVPLIPGEPYSPFFLISANELPPPSFERSRRKDMNLSLWPRMATSRSNASAGSRRKSSPVAEWMRMRSRFASARSSASVRSSTRRRGEP